MDEFLQTESLSDPVMSLTETHATDVSTENILRSGMVFLAENPEAYGLVTDAYPVATDKWLITAHGRGAPTGSLPLTISMRDSGTATLFQELFARNEAGRTILSKTFGEDATEEHPTTRYAATLAELTVLDILSEAPEDISFEELAERLGAELPCALYELRERICQGGLAADESELFTVSLGICRLSDQGDGHHTVDLFTTGETTPYLIDADGMRPLWVEPGRDLSPEGVSSAELAPTNRGEALAGKRLRLHHPEPFAILLLSDGATSLNAAELRNLAEAPGLVWYYRMRLEASVLRILAASAKESEFEHRASRFFTGRLQGRESASGALNFVSGNGSAAAFRADCAARLHRVEDLIALLPDGYDPDRVTELVSRDDLEKGYICRLLAEENGLSDRAGTALLSLALDRLADHLSGERADADETVGEASEESSPFRRLSSADVYEVFRLYDEENDADRAMLAANAAVLREQFAAHWITLRPAVESLCADLSSDEAPQDAAERSYEMCLTLNARLGERLSARRQKLTRLKDLLTEGLQVISTEETDWACGRAGDGQIAGEIGWLSAELAAAAEDLLDDHKADTDRYRSLLSAYMSERDTLFTIDTSAPHGFFAEDYRRICEGTLPEERWNDMQKAIADTVASDDEHASTYDDLIRALRRISCGTGALRARIRARAADRRMARDLAGRSDLQIAAIHASAYQESDWGEEVCEILDEGERKAYMAVVHRWQETRELMNRQADAYRTYRDLYYDGKP